MSMFYYQFISTVIYLHLRFACVSVSTSVYTYIYILTLCFPPLPFLPSFTHPYREKMLPRAIVSSMETDIVLRAPQMSLLLTQVLAALASRFILLCSALAQSAKDRHLTVWVCLAEPWSDSFSLIWYGESDNLKQHQPFINLCLYS